MEISHLYNTGRAALRTENVANLIKKLAYSAQLREKIAFGREKRYTEYIDAADKI